MEGDVTVRAVPLGVAWDHLVASDRGQVFASSAFLELIEAELVGSIPHHLGAFRGDTLVGVMPLLIRRDPALGAVGNSSPYFGSHGGVYASLEGSERAECVRALLSAYRDTCKAEGCVLSNVVEPLGTGDRSLYAEELSPWRTDLRIGQVVENPSADAEEMFARYHQKTRNMVRKAVRAGVEVQRTTDSSALKFLAEAHAGGLKQIGGKAKTREFFESVPDYLAAGAGWEIFEATIEGERVACLLVLRFGDSTEYFTPVTLPEHRSSQPMSLIVHTAILDTGERAGGRFNFGGTWQAQEGVYRFKSRFGAQDIPYSYYVSSYAGNQPFADRDTEQLLAAFDGYYLFPFS